MSYNLDWKNTQEEASFPHFLRLELVFLTPFFSSLDPAWQYITHTTEDGALVQV